MTSTAPAAAAPAASSAQERNSLNGCWILDRSRGNPSMRGYLETMGVNELAIQAHEKGDAEHDTLHTIQLDSKTLKMTKRSRVNADIVVQLELGKECNLSSNPNNSSSSSNSPQRPTKTSLAVSNHVGHVEIQSSLLTVNGMARVVDVKNFHKEKDEIFLVQQLTITNEAKGISH
eukprot:CAMPEP_0116832586 /NCGR_PEP_ID=MMETSP0418-20121206/5974_1 /TAXON_ID=1158023 /ORGANISM="Astrosyne radiata, Strain 13vi08-1A" /LENGTH=174 /DNA_ID=CAMNT_0004461963 /DNA_START=461 /DNA_END=982 /DNA_ORIENTATION=+